MYRSQALRELAPLKSNEARLTPGDTVRSSSRIRCCSADATSYPTSITPRVPQVDVHYWASRWRRPSEGCRLRWSRYGTETRSTSGRDRLQSRMKFDADDGRGLWPCVQCNYESTSNAKFASLR